MPHVNGGGRFIVDWLVPVLQEHGHSVERFFLPAVDHPSKLYSQMTAFRLLDFVDKADRVITFRPPAHVVAHPFKIVWFIHHIRGLYDLWGTPYATLPDTPGGRRFRYMVRQTDTAMLAEARKVFTNSNTVSKRLRQFNGLESRVLYPPVWAPERFRFDYCGDEIVVICRMERHKRQHLLVEAMRHVRTPVRLRLCGASSDPGYIAELQALAAGFHDARVVLELGWISEADKIERIARALAVAYFAFDEDSYGYPVLEAAHARKAAVVATDGGGVLEFVIDQQTGLTSPPEPAAIAEQFDRLWIDRAAAARWGRAAAKQVGDLGIGWPVVVEALTG